MDNIVTWNIPNFITVGVMGLVMFTLFGMIAAWWATRNQSTAG